MPVCPFCQADLPLPNLPCGACGKLMRDHPSLSAGKSYSVKPALRTSGQIPAVRAPAAQAAVAAMTNEAPELELSTRHAPKRPAKAPSLPPAVPKPSAPRGVAGGSGASGAPPSSQKPSGPTAIPGVGGAVFDEDDIGGGGEAIELDMMPGPAPAPVPSAAPSRPKAISGAPAATSMAPLARGPVSRAPAPPDEHDEARALADYGDSPTSFWHAPLYAYRVKTRQSELRRQLAEREADLDRAQKAEEQARVTFAERARPIAERLEGYTQVLEPIGKAERVMMQRDTALSAELAAHKARVTVIDDRVHGLSAELEAAKAEERDVEAKLAEADAVRQRAEAKLKRAEIEIRNATSVAGAGGVNVGPARRAGSPP